MEAQPALFRLTTAHFPISQIEQGYKLQEMLQQLNLTVEIEIIPPENTPNFFLNDHQQLSQQDSDKVDSLDYSDSDEHEITRQGYQNGIATNRENMLRPTESRIAYQRDLQNSRGRVKPEDDPWWEKREGKRLPQVTSNSPLRSTKEKEDKCIQVARTVKKPPRPESDEFDTSEAETPSNLQNLTAPRMRRSIMGGRKTRSESMRPQERVEALRTTNSASAMPSKPDIPTEASRTSIMTKSVSRPRVSVVSPELPAPRRNVPPRSISPKSLSPKNPLLRDITRQEFNGKDVIPGKVPVTPMRQPGPSSTYSDGDDGAVQQFYTPPDFGSREGSAPLVHPKSNTPNSVTHGEDDYQPRKICCMQS